MRKATFSRLAALTGLGLGLLTSACSLATSFDQCTIDTDCVDSSGAGQRLFCTSDHLCVVGTPKERLCNEPYPANSPANAIPIGGLFKVKGGYDALTKVAVQLAVDEINKARKSTGARPLVMHTCEIGGSDDDPLKSMQLLTREKHVVVVLGPSSSQNVSDVAPEVTASGTPIISPSSTSTAITGLPGDGLFFRIPPADDQQGPAMSKVVGALGLPATAKTALLYVDDPYGQGLQKSFLNAYGKQTTPYTYTEKTGDAKAQSLAEIQSAAQKIIASKPDLLVAISNNYSSEVLRALVGLNGQTPTTKIVMGDGGKNDLVLSLLQPADNVGNQFSTLLANVSGTAPTVDLNNSTGTAAYQTFLNNFMVKSGMDARNSIFSAYGYDAAYAAGIALGSIDGEPTPALVSERLLRFNKNGGAVRVIVGSDSYNAAAQKMATTANLTLLGTTGVIQFTPHGDRLNGLYERWTVNTTTKQFMAELAP